MTSQQSTGANSIDPRVARTRALVLDRARQLVGAQGIGAISYTALAADTRVTRQTLYRHWPTLDTLLLEMAVDGPVENVAPGADARGTLTSFLRSFRDGVSADGGANPLAVLMAQAEHDEAAADAVKKAATDRMQALNKALRGTGQTVTVAQMPALIGPVLYRRFLQRTAVTNKFIDETVNAWLLAYGK